MYFDNLIFLNYFFLQVSHLYYSICLIINIEIFFYSPSDIEYDEFIKSNIGDTTLVVGHSNTIPGFVNELIDYEYYQQIDDFNNSNLYVVNICDGINPQNSLYFVE